MVLAEVGGLVGSLSGWPGSVRRAMQQLQLSLPLRTQVALQVTLGGDHITTDWREGRQKGWDINPTYM